jgi:hypothetical protein
VCVRARARMRAHTYECTVFLGGGEIFIAPNALIFLHQT